MANWQISAYAIAYNTWSSLVLNLLVMQNWDQI